MLLPEAPYPKDKSDSITATSISAFYNDLSLDARPALDKGLTARMVTLNLKKIAGKSERTYLGDLTQPKVVYAPPGSLSSSGWMLRPFLLLGPSTPGSLHGLSTLWRPELKYLLLSFRSPVTRLKPVHDLYIALSIFTTNQFYPGVSSEVAQDPLYHILRQTECDCSTPQHHHQWSLASILPLGGPERLHHHRQVFL